MSKRLMNNNPFHSQDSTLEFGMELITPPPESPSSDSPSDFSAEMNLDSWVQKCLDSSCCKKDCFSTTAADGLIRFQTKYRQVPRNNQDVCIKGVLLSSQTVRNGRNPKFQYNVFPFGNLCRKAFCLLFHISNQKLQNIINDMDTFCCRKHGNKGIPFVTALTPIEKQLTKDWLLEFALIHGEKKPGRRYGTRIRDVDFIRLPATFTLKKLHELYLLQEIRDISFETFRKLYHKLESSKSEAVDSTCAILASSINYS